METPVTEDELRALRAGGRLKYHGVQWRIDDFSTYTDPNGYEMEEWLLKSGSGKEYYLLREVDPNNPEGRVHWYIAEELRSPKIYDPSSNREVSVKLVEEMRSRRTPYPSLQLFNRLYQFESQTEGTYESHGESRSRITWDYWDETHLWNLGLEAWSNNLLVVYSTREVQPADFTNVQHGVLAQVGNSYAAPPIASNYSSKMESRSLQLIIAWFLTIVGFFLMVGGI